MSTRTGTLALDVDDLTRTLLAARDGDDLCLAAWIRRSQAEVRRLCAHLVDHDSVDDLTQETYLRAWRALPAFRGDSTARTWLLSIARRVCADAIRSRTRQRRLLPRAAPWQLRNRPDPADRIAAADLLRRLDADRREAFVLTQFLGLTYLEAATVCDCPLGTIRSRVSRARDDLLRAIEAEATDVKASIR